MNLLTIPGGDPRVACRITFVHNNAMEGNPVIQSTAIRKGDVQGTAGVGQKRKRTSATSKRKKRKLSANKDMNADDEEAEASDGNYEEEEPRPKKVSS